MLWKISITLKTSKILMKYMNVKKILKDIVKTDHFKLISRILLNHGEHSVSFYYFIDEKESFQPSNRFITLFIKFHQTSSISYVPTFLPTYLPIYWAWHYSAQACPFFICMSKGILSFHQAMVYFSNWNAEAELTLSPMGGGAFLRLLRNCDS